MPRRTNPPQGMLRTPLPKVRAPEALLLGRVAWCRREDDHVEAGLEFIGLTAAERARLRERVEALQQA